MTTTIFRLYTLFGHVMSFVTPGALRERVAEGKEDPVRFRERLGVASVPRPEGKLVWLHGVSVGESLSLLPVVEGLRALRPDLTLLVTSTTVTSATLLAQRLPAGVIHQYAAVDGPGYVRCFLDHWRPEVAVFCESDLWPQTLEQLRARGARTALLSGRMSHASFNNWSMLTKLSARVFGRFDLLMAQDPFYAGVYKKLGGRDDGCLNLKLAGAPLPVNAEDRVALEAQLQGRPVLVGASTHELEEEIVLNAFWSLAQRPDRPLLVLAPRHPDRADEVMAIIAQTGLKVARRSLGDVVTPETQVLLADTLGEMGLWYTLARLAYIGGSLSLMQGGHNPLEPARLKCPFVTGSNNFNWRSIYQGLKQVDGYRIVMDSASLAYAFADALDKPEAVRARAERAFGFADQRANQLTFAITRISELADGK